MCRCRALSTVRLFICTFRPPDYHSQVVQTSPVPFAVLDLRFSRHKPNIFAVAASTGAVHLFSFDPKSDCPITHNHHIVVAPTPDILLLCLAWSPSSLSSVAVTLSDGTVAIVDTNKATVMFKLSQAHSLEAWVVAWSRVSASPALYTGGDDSTICCHRLQEDPQLDRPSVPPSTNGIRVRDNKIHGAGVTSILPLWVDNHAGEILLTGSYDENVRVIGVAPGSTRPKVLAEEGLNGGVWQLRYLELPGDSGLANERRPCFSILASCMHAGCRVLEVRRSAQKDWTIKVLGIFEGHESMNYASDARMEPKGQTLQDMTFLSTSFYDKKLCIWKLETS